MSDYEQLLQEITNEFPDFCIISKRDHKLSCWIDRFLKLVTLGRQSEYLTHYHTVLGDTLYVPLSWEACPDPDRIILLRHERIHLRQRRRYGTLLMSFLYVFPWFPLGLAYWRARLEWEAYTETLRATAEIHGLAAARDPELRRKIVGRFTGPAYGWMWPFKGQVEGWYNEVIAELTGIQAE